MHKLLKIVLSILIVGIQADDKYVKPASDILAKQSEISLIISTAPYLSYMRQLTYLYNITHNCLAQKTLDIAIKSDLKTYLTDYTKINFTHAEWNMIASNSVSCTGIQALTKQLRSLVKLLSPNEQEKITLLVKQVEIIAEESHTKKSTVLLPNELTRAIMQFYDAAQKELLYVYLLHTLQPSLQLISEQQKEVLIPSFIKNITINDIRRNIDTDSHELENILTQLNTLSTESDSDNIVARKVAIEEEIKKEQAILPQPGRSYTQLLQEQDEQYAQLQANCCPELQKEYEQLQQELTNVIQQAKEAKRKLKRSENLMQNCASDEKLEQVSNTLLLAYNQAVEYIQSGGMAHVALQMLQSVDPAFVQQVKGKDDDFIKTRIIKIYEELENKKTTMQNLQQSNATCVQKKAQYDRDKKEYDQKRVQVAQTEDKLQKKYAHIVQQKQTIKRPVLPVKTSEEANKARQRIQNLQQELITITHVIDSNKMVMQQRAHKKEELLKNLEQLLKNNRIVIRLIEKHLQKLWSEQKYTAILTFIEDVVEKSFVINRWLFPNPKPIDMARIEFKSMPDPIQSLNHFVTSRKKFVQEMMDLQPAFEQRAKENKNTIKSVQEKLFTVKKEDLPKSFTALLIKQPSWNEKIYQQAKNILQPFIQKFRGWQNYFFGTKTSVQKP